MRIAPLEGEDGLNDDGEDADMSLMEKELKDFTERKDIKKAAETDRCVRKMLTQIEKYKDRLFTNGIEVIDAQGNKVFIYCERTNNIAERAFRDEKRGHRKRTGNKSMSQILKTMLAETPYVKNLSNTEYLKIILNKKKTLAERFAEINGGKVREAMQKHHEKLEKLDPNVKKVIKTDGLLQNIVETILNFGPDDEESAAPATSENLTESKLIAGLVCDEFEFTSLYEKLHEPDSSLQSISFPFLAGTASRESIRVHKS